jgi:hypothetical protein
MLAFIARIRHPCAALECPNAISKEFIMVRLRTRWNQKDRDRSIEQIASAIGVNIWKIASEGLLNLENEGFETVSHSQRLDVIAELVAFMIHISDRLVYGDLSDEERRDFVTALALHLTNTMQDNRVDANGPGQYQDAFIQLLNSRMEDYSECSYTDQEGPGFSLKRILGERVRDEMGAKDNKWIPDYVIDAEAPKAVESLQKVLQGMLDLGSQQGDPLIPKSGVWGEG